MKRPSSATITRPRRAAALAAGALTMTLAFNVFGAGTAHAVNTYIECPVLRVGSGCGFESVIRSGSYLITFRFQKTEGGYGAETQIGSCPRVTCFVGSWYRPDPTRTPAGFDISSDGGVTLIRRTP